MPEYVIKNARRAKGIKITIYQDGRVSVTKPRWVSKKVAQEFVLEKKDWIESEVAKNKSNPGNILGRYGIKEFAKQKEIARKLVHKKLAQWNAVYNFEYKNVSIRNQRTRWGSCSSRKNLSFNFKIVYLPEELQDYLIVHELCHLQEMNHGKKFWDLVGQTIPEYRTLRVKLRTGDI